MTNPKTRTRKLAQDYLQLGGTRLVVIDDNNTSVRHWKDESQAASLFWRDNIEPLDEESWNEVVLLLPSVSDEDTELAGGDPIKGQATGSLQRPARVVPMLHDGS